MALPFLLLCALAQASVVLSGTRIIFPASEKEATLQITNSGDLPAVVQAWLDKGDSTASLQNVSVPFVMTPSLFRMEPRKGQTLRIIHSGEPLPTDRESLFWLNVLDVPPKAQDEEDANSLQFAFRTRIKLIYRPKGLQGTALDAPAQLQWSLRTQADGRLALQARNGTPFIVNLGDIALESGGHSANAGAGHVLPGQTADFPLPESASTGLRGGTVKFTAINDWGGGQSHEAPLAR
ncbi:Chaperone protein focC precursor [Delftia tsuruhatensis]|nr:Chaperone protein focC precursor [Delftia tsuruhatensis]CAC9676736.1 Chaperone protein focC precursor [Delftia tsuruhatensis]